MYVYDIHCRFYQVLQSFDRNRIYVAGMEKMEEKPGDMLHLQIEVIVDSQFHSSRFM